jgi:PHD/YefM family antitoxin component YafN of YafNO toxin-antitoxin module
MKRMTVEQVAGDFQTVLDQVENEHEEVMIVRNRHDVARIVPEPESQTALQVLDDLYQTLDPRAAEAWVKGIAQARHQGTLGELRHSWGS